jgi:hypothetical protein
MSFLFNSQKQDIGDDFEPGPLLTSIDELGQNGVNEETVLRVKGARVVYANYNLLQQDFPQLRDKVLVKEFPHLKTLHDLARQKAIRRKINNWMLRHTAFISQSQADQDIVNTPIAIGKEKVKAFRPPYYGRALVFSIEENNRVLMKGKLPASPFFENRLIDVKGIGVAPHVKPVNVVHGNGLCQTGDILYELLIQELLQRIFRQSKSAIHTVPVYGIIDLGFNEQENNICKNPAGLLIRRAHRRPENPAGLYPYDSTGQKVQLEVELLLRKYGITSVDSGTTVKIWKENGQLQIKYGRKHVDFFNDDQKAEIERVSHYNESMGVLQFDGINIQHTREIGLNPTLATLVDFQAYRIFGGFENPLLSLVSDKLLLWGGSIWPDHKNFVRPEPSLQIPVDIFRIAGKRLGYDCGEGDCYETLNVFCFKLAKDFREKKINCEMLRNALQSYLNIITEHWQ